MLFDVYLQLQSARLQEQRSTKDTNLVRGTIRRLRQSLIARQTTTAAKPEGSEVSRALALSFLLTSDDDGPF
jgi:hypothetical protein